MLPAEDGVPAGEVAAEALSALVGRLRKRDPAGAVTLSREDGVLFGSAAGECGSGAEPAPARALRRR